MLKSLRKALATFAQGDRGGTGKGEGEEDTVRDDSAALAEYAHTALTTDGGPAAPGIKQPPPRYDLSRIDFARLRAEFDKTPHKSVVMLNLQEKLEQRLAAMVAVNPSRVDLYERCQEIVAEYNRDKDAVEVQKVMDALITDRDVDVLRMLGCNHGGHCCQSTHGQFNGSGNRRPRQPT